MTGMLAVGRVEVRDPADGSAVTVLPMSSQTEVAAAVAVARAALPSWAGTAAAERADAVGRAADAVAAHADELVRLNTREMGTGRSCSTS